MRKRIFIGVMLLAGFPGLYSGTVSGMETDSFGLPVINMSFLDYDTGTKERISIPNEDFLDGLPDGRPSGWSYDYHFNPNVNDVWTY
jgi:hypothetical protein